MKKIKLTGVAVTLSVLMVFAGCSKTAETSAETSASASMATSGEPSLTSEVSETSETSKATEDTVSKITVYKDSEDVGEAGTFVTPGVKLGDTDLTEINDEIKAFVSGLMKDSEWFNGTEYSCYDGGDHVSLLIRGISSIDCDSYKAFNISAKTGKLMTTDELLAVAGTDSNAFAELVKKTVSDAMEDDKEGSLFTVIEDMDYKAENLKDDNIAKAQPFISDRGNLCFIYDLSYVCRSR